MQGEEEEEEEVDIEAVDDNGEEESEGADFGSMPTEEQLPGMQKSKPDKYAKLSQLWASVRLLLRPKLNMFELAFTLLAGGKHALLGNRAGNWRLPSVYQKGSVILIYAAELSVHAFNVPQH